MNDHPRTSLRTILIIAAAIMLALFAIPKSVAAQYNKGDQWTLQALCTLGTSYEQVRAAILMSDWALYVELMRDPKIKCYDVRMMPGTPPIQATFMTIVEDACTMMNNPVRFVKLLDGVGVAVISWHSMEGPCPKRASLSLEPEGGTDRFTRYTIARLHNE